MAHPSDTSGMEFEVFLSFRGPDTRNHFTSYLYHDMDEKGIRVFKDDRELKVGEKIQKLFKALDNSQIYIPIFSKNFASSAWCLREVVKMVERAKNSNGKKEILPIFFDVEPEDVKSSTGLYSNALSELEKVKAEEYGDEKEKLKYHPDEVKSWRDALREVASIVGWKLEGKEGGELIKSIVNEVLLKLKVKNRHLPDSLVKMHDEYHIEVLLQVDSADDVRFVVIYGTGGIGKTTLASIIFNRFRCKFSCSSFLEDVQDLSQRGGLIAVQKKLLTDTLGSTSAHGIQDTNEGIDQISKGLSNKKVLVVVDNVNNEEQLNKLVGSYTWFGFGSRIIITLRDRTAILNWTARNNDKQTQPSRYTEYQVQEMDMNRAVQLFSKHAFRNNTPPKDWFNLSHEVVSRIGRLPLTLEVVGCLFDTTDRSKWDQTLKDLKQVPRKKVRETLMMSVNKLDTREKEIFLDIACFCIGENKKYAYYMWDDCDFTPYSAINDLVRMSLIKINEYRNTFWMHDEVRDLGRYIANEKNLEDAGNRRCLVIDKDNLDILMSNEKRGDVRALNLAICHRLIPEEITHMPKLRFLKGHDINFEGDFKTLLPNLRWLSCRIYPLDFLAMNLHLVKLVVLNLSGSMITHEWGGWRHIEMRKRLKILDLTQCHGLTQTPDFLGFDKLEKLILEGCRYLSTIGGSIINLKCLSTLNIKGCESLEGLPEEIGSLECLSEIVMPHEDTRMDDFKPFKLPETLGNLKYLTNIKFHPGISQLPHSIGRLNLTHLDLSLCDNIQELPDSIGELESLIMMDLNFSRISFLPDSIGRLKNLKYLLLSECKNLHKLPDSIGELKSLVELDLKFSGISILPNSIGGLMSLTHLYFCGCDNLFKLPDSIGELEALVKLVLKFSEISILPNSIEGLRNLKHLLLHKLPISIELLESLVELDLEFSGIYVPPNSIGRLTSLKYLSFSRCKNLLELPSSIGELEALVVLDLRFSGISTLPDSIGRLKNLNHLRISECKNLNKLPYSIGQLDSLIELDLKLSRISVLPNSIGKLTNITHLSCFGCENLLELPNSIGELEALVEFDLQCSGIRILPDSIGRLKNLKRLLLLECKNLGELPNSIGQLESLVELNLKLSRISFLPNSIGRLTNFTDLSFYGCMNLSELPSSIGELESLVTLDFKFSGISVLPNSIGMLTNLRRLSFFECVNLVELPGSIGELESLVVLDLRFSGISSIPDSIGGLKNLKKLLLLGCKNLCELPNSIRQSKSLVELDLRLGDLHSS